MVPRLGCRADVHILRHTSELDAGVGELSRPSPTLEEASLTTLEADGGVSAIFYARGGGHSGAHSKLTALAHRGCEDPAGRDGPGLGEQQTLFGGERVGEWAGTGHLGSRGEEQSPPHQRV